MRILWVVAALCFVGCQAHSDGTVRPTNEVITTSEGRVILQCEPADAQVLLDGVPMGMCSDFDRADRGLKVGTGLHRVDVKKPGHVPFYAEVAPDKAEAMVHATLPLIQNPVPEK